MLLLAAAAVCASCTPAPPTGTPAATEVLESCDEAIVDETLDNMTDAWVDAQLSDAASGDSDGRRADLGDLTRIAEPLDTADYPGLPVAAVSLAGLTPACGSALALARDGSIVSERVVVEIDAPSRTAFDRMTALLLALGYGLQWDDHEPDALLEESADASPAPVPTPGQALLHAREFVAPGSDMGSDSPPFEGDRVQLQLYYGVGAVTGLLYLDYFPAPSG